MFSVLFETVLSVFLDLLSFLFVHTSDFILPSSFFFLLLCSSHHSSIRDVVALLISLYRVGTRWTSSVFLPVPIPHDSSLTLFLMCVSITYTHALILSHLFQRYLSYSLVS